MPHFTRYALTVSSLVLVLAMTAAAQQQAPQQQSYGQAAAPQQLAPQQPSTQQESAQQVYPQQGAPQPAPAQASVAPQPPQGFALNTLQQAALDQVLGAWENESDKINTFKCPFERWEYDMAFGPGPDIPLYQNLGELSFSKPDKGSFQITEIKKFQEQPVPAGQKPPAQVLGNYVKQPDAIGEHWVCDGKSVFEYRHNQKQLVERPIPPEFQGKAIAEGPLPFVFGAKAATLKQRYWMVIGQENQTQIWLRAKPRFPAADFSEVQVILDRQQLLPQAMQVHMPNGDRHMYIFKLAEASKNSKFAMLQSLFDRPRVPGGWKRVVENVPVQQAAEPNPTPR